MDNHPMGWPLLYETPLGMFCLYGNVMLNSFFCVSSPDLWFCIILFLSSFFNLFLFPFIFVPVNWKCVYSILSLNTVLLSSVLNLQFLCLSADSFRAFVRFFVYLSHPCTSTCHTLECGRRHCSSEKAVYVEFSTIGHGSHNDCFDFM